MSTTVSASIRSRPSPKLSSQVLNSIVSSIEALRFGSVEIIIHDSKVVQLEKKEKFRFVNQDEN